MERQLWWDQCTVSIQRKKAWKGWEDGYEAFKWAWVVLFIVIVIVIASKTEVAFHDHFKKAFFEHSAEMFGNIWLRRTSKLSLSDANCIIMKFLNSIVQLSYPRKRIICIRPLYLYQACQNVTYDSVSTWCQAKIIWKPICFHREEILKSL